MSFGQHVLFIMELNLDCLCTYYQFFKLFNDNIKTTLCFFSFSGTIFGGVSFAKFSKRVVG